MLAAFSDTCWHSSVYGPVESWRLGKSLGVDLLGNQSTCSFRCVYCQLGKIERPTSHRGVFVSTAKLEADLHQSDWRSARVVTFSGSGEPTLALNIGEAISAVKRITGKPVVILTNSTLLNDRRVRSDIDGADLLFCKLDAWTDDTMERFDRPVKGLRLESVVSGIRSMKRDFRGFLALQTMLLRKLSRHELEQYADLVRLIGPDEVQLNLPSRPIPISYSVENRGNQSTSKGKTRTLRLIPKSDVNAIADFLRKETGIPVSTR